MGPGMGFGPPPSEDMDKLKEPKPKNIREVPGYLSRLTGSFFSRLFYIFGLVWETRPWILFLMLFMAVFNGVMPVVSAYITALLLNTLVAAYNHTATFAAVMGYLVLQFAYLFASSLVTNVNTILMRISGELVVNHIQVKIMNKAKEVDLKSFDQPDFYSKLENASREAGNRPIQIMNSTFGILSELISMVSFIVILWAVSPAAPFIILLVSIPSAVINFCYRKKNVLYMRFRSKDRRQLNYYSQLMTNKDMVKEIRIFGLSDLFIGRYQSVFERYFKGLKKLYVGEGAWHIALTLVSSAVNCFLFLYIARGVCDGRLSIGDYSLYTGALRSIASGIAGLISTTASIYEGTLFIDNMIAFMNEKKTVVPRLAEPLKPARHTAHTIQFENVSFRYPGTERDVLKNITCTLRPGETAVLVGLNGAGKTTLIKLLTRLYDPTEGRILLDGHDLRDYDTDALYAMFGIIFQDFGKYAVTVRENIAFGGYEKGIVDTEVREAAEASDARHFIEALPDGYETPLMRYFESNGIELSIGQWQKLAIARAFYSDSDILILDEPTASLDAIAEQEVFNQFDSLRRNKTTIFVSHRLSSATTATKILVLENGELIEEGTHEELMKKGGHYCTLFSTQARRYIESGPEKIIGAVGTLDQDGTPAPDGTSGQDQPSDPDSTSGLPFAGAPFGREHGGGNHPGGSHSGRAFPAPSDGSGHPPFGGRPPENRQQ